MKHHLVVTIYGIRHISKRKNPSQNFKSYKHLQIANRITPRAIKTVGMLAWTLHKQKFIVVIKQMNSTTKQISNQEYRYCLAWSNNNQKWHLIKLLLYYVPPFTLHLIQVFWQFGHPTRVFNLIWKYFSRMHINCNLTTDQLIHFLRLDNHNFSEDL